MSNRVETFGNYAGSLINRTIGRSAWKEAMQRPASWDDYYNDRSGWTRALNITLIHSAPLYAFLELTFPVTSRIMTPVLRTTSETLEEHPSLAMLRITALPADVVLWLPALFLTNNFSEAVCLRAATNIAVQTGVDLAEVAIHKLGHSKPPSTMTLAV